jgi:hypothetical protein
MHTAACVLLIALLAPTSVGAQGSVLPNEPAFEVVAQQAQAALSEQLRREHHGRAVALPPFYRRLQASVERQMGLPWRGPAPRAVVTDGRFDAVSCDGGRCEARLESVRVVSGTDSTVAVVVVLADRTLLDERVWTHELTHALLMQHGLVAESIRHDPRWFSRALLAMR